MVAGAIDLGLKLGLWGFVTLFIALPFSLVLAQSFLPHMFDRTGANLIPSLEGFRRLYETSRLAAGFGNTMIFGALVAIGATALGAALAVLLRLTDVPFSSLWGMVPWFLLAIPSFLKGLAFVLLLSPGGYLVELGALTPDLARKAFGPVGLFLVMTIALFPFPYFIASARLAGLGGEFIDAARLAGAPASRILTRIVIPLMGPALALGALTTFAEAIGDYGIAATVAQSMNVGLLTANIANATTQYPPDFPAAAAGSVVLGVLVATTVGLAAWLGGTRRIILLSGRSRALRLFKLSWLAKVLACAALALLAVTGIVLPVLAIIARALTRSLSAGLAQSNWNLKAVLGLFAADPGHRQPLIDSLAYASIVASIEVMLALTLALMVWRFSSGVRGLVLASALALRSLPGIILAFGFILMFAQLPLFKATNLYGSRTLLVLGFIASSLPLALLLLSAAIDRLSPTIHDASRLAGATFAQHISRIVMPLVQGTLIAAFGLGFLRVMYELPISSLLMPLDGPPFSVIIVSDFTQDRDQKACALALLGLVVLGSLALVYTLIAWMMTPKGSNEAPA